MELTPRESQVLSLVSTGSQNKEVARILSISECTVERHLTQIYQKIGVSNRTEASIWYIGKSTIDMIVQKKLP
jgi:DNA-binding NarL/FixJ family response regulator